MDLEGAEGLALEGARAMLEKTDYLIYESWNISHTVNNSVDAILEEAGFALQQIDGNNWLAARKGLFVENMCKAKL
jgi:hypothetical protein